MSDVGDQNAVVLEERGVLKKWDGDLTDEEREVVPPAEEVHVVDGEITKYIVNKEVVYDHAEGIGHKPVFEDGEITHPVVLHEVPAKKEKK